MSSRHHQGPGEDALNIVRSDFVIDGTTFDTTLSDAFDSASTASHQVAFINIGPPAAATRSILGVGGRDHATSRRQVSDRSGRRGPTVTASAVIDGHRHRARQQGPFDVDGIENLDHAALTAYIKKPRRRHDHRRRVSIAWAIPWSTAAASCSPGANSTPRTSTSTRLRHRHETRRPLTHRAIA